MMLKLLLLIIFVKTSLSQQTGNCTVDAINAAQKAFNSFCGFDSSITWQNPVGLALAVQNKYIAGPKSDGLVNVCNGYNQYLKSLSDAGISYQKCLDPHFIIDNDATPATGYGYAGIMNMIGYHCGAGLYPALTKFPCIQNTYKIRRDNLINCLKNLHLDAQANATAACAYTKTAIQCWQNEFIQTCSNDNEIAYYGCESIRQYTSAAYGECDDRCIIFQAPSFAVDRDIQKLKEYDYSAQKAPALNKILLEQIKQKLNIDKL